MKIKEKSTAVLVVHGLGKMSPEEREQIALWLVEQAKSFTKKGYLYSEGRFTAKYLANN